MRPRSGARSSSLPGCRWNRWTFFFTRPSISACDQSRRSGSGPTTSGLPLLADNFRVRRHVSKVPQPDELKASKRHRYTRKHITGCSLRPNGNILRDDLRIETEQLRICRINRHAHPMRIRIAKGLDAREVFKRTIDLLAIERLVDTKPVGIPVQEGNWLVVALQLVRKRVDIVFEC